MPESLSDSPQIVKEAAEAVSFSDVKAVGEAGAILQNLAMANQVHAQNLLYQLGPSIVAKATDSINNLQPAEGTAAAGILHQLIRGAGQPIPGPAV